MKINNCINKNRIAIGVFVSVVVLMTGSCKKLIEIPPNPPTSIVSSQQFSDSLSTLSAIVYAYYYQGGSGTAGFTFNNGNLALATGLSSDELAPTFTTGDGPEFYNNIISPVDNGTNGSLWSAPYLGVYPLNSAIEGINASTGISASFKAQATAEMKLLRALYYFQLVNLFGPVPLVTSTHYISNEVLPRSPVDTIYGQIVADLQYAQQNLSVSYPTAGHLRPNKYAASALLAKTYLYLGQWQQAYDAADPIISSNVYSLEPNLNNVFLDGSREAIWQIPADNSSVVVGEASAFVVSPGLVPNYVLTSTQLSAFDPGDLRLQDWVGVSPVDTGTGTINLYFPYKYKNYQQWNEPTNEDYMIFRLGEVYLIHAEAAAELGNLGTALTDLNTIRARAGLPASTATTQPQVLAAIAKERQAELFTEWGNRWEDLKRTGVINTVLGSEKHNWTADAALFPVPQAERTLNSALTQNPGY